MADVVVRWAGPSDATASSTYEVEVNTGSGWSTLAAAQASTSPYASVNNTLASNTSYGAATVSLTDASSFSTTGYGYIDDALIYWGGKSTNDLTSVVWYTGNPTAAYASGTTVYEAHESHSATGLTIDNGAVAFRITHTLSSISSRPTMIWHYEPPVSDDRTFCTVVVQVGADVSNEFRTTVQCQCYLTDDDQFSTITGAHLDSNQVTANTQSTNNLGLAFFDCVIDGYRKDETGDTLSTYSFVLDSDDATNKATFLVSSIPDQPWALLSQLVG